MQKVKVKCQNTNTVMEVEMGTSLREILPQFNIENQHPFLAAYVNNRVKELNYRIYKPLVVRFIDITHFEGYRVYERTISFILQKAVHMLSPDRELHIRHTIANGVYCEFADDIAPTSEQVAQIKSLMQDIIQKAYPIERETLPTAEVEKIYSEFGYEDKIALLNTRKRLYSDLYRMDDMVGYFYGALTPDSGYIDLFDICPYYKGFYVGLPSRSNPKEVYMTPQREKMLDVFQQYHAWVEVMGIPTVGMLNEKILKGDGGILIKVAEALHERKMGQVSDMIYKANTERGLRMVLISGPSSSGKTTTAKRLGIQLRIMGLEPVLISLDDYFVERHLTPRDQTGEYDYEALEAIDLKLLNEDLQRLEQGESVEIPRYDFITGTRQWHDKPLQLNDRSILILEGIHALNPRLTPSIARDKKFCIYASCLTSVAMDNLSRIATSDNRLIRRMTRDYYTRGNSGLDTLRRWESVRRGEEKHIFPYQENADVMINTSLFYEICVLRNKVEPILREIPDTEVEYAEARRLLKFLDNFTPLYTDDIPPTSILREFIGGSSFKY